MVLTIAAQTGKECIEFIIKTHDFRHTEKGNTTGKFTHFSKIPEVKIKW